MALRPAPGPDPGPHVLLDRADELAAVDRLLARAAEGRGSLLLIDGDPGIGKTVLVRAARHRAAERGMRVLAARGGELEGDLAFGVVRELLGPATRPDAPGTGAAALAGPVLGTFSVPPPDVDVFGVLHGLYWLCVGIGEARPVLLAVDDAHWADAPSLRFLTYLARRLDDLPVALLVATRPTGRDPAVHELLEILSRESSPVRPRPLGRTAVGELASAALGGRAAGEFVDACRESTGGNPFLVRELLAELRSAGVPPVAARVDRVATVAPEGVRRAIVARLAALPEGAASLARAAAVLGDGADPRWVARLAGLHRDQVGDLVDVLVTARILAPRLPLSFVHPLVRSAVVTAAGPAALAALHRRAAQVIEADGGAAELVVPHLLGADPRGDADVVEQLREAARRATARGAPEVAVRYLRRALAEPPTASVRHLVLLDLGRAETQVGAAEALDHLTEAVDVAPDPVARARAALLLARTLFESGRLTEAVHTSEAAIAWLDGTEPDLAGELEAELLTAAIQDTASHAVADRLSAARRADPEPTSLPNCMLLANMAALEVRSAGCRTRAEQLAELALTDGHLLGRHGELTLPGALLSLTLCGRERRAIQVWDEAIAGQRARGDVAGFARASAFRGYASYLVGDLRVAVAEIRSAVELAQGANLLRMVEGLATAWLVYALTDTGEHEAADDELAAQTWVVTAGPPLRVSALLSARGRLRLAQGRFDEAVADLEECGRRVAAWNATGPGLCTWRPHLALALLGRGERDRADAVAQEALHRARAWGAPYTLAEALRAAGTVTVGPPGEALLREAVAVAVDAPVERARALTALGGLLRRAGHRAAAREPLRAALDLALDRGAAAIAREARDELVASGARPRRLRTNGVDALTATERRVAAMAASGLTNRSVAQALFVSEKTVETHLGATFRKLGISSRTQLGEALR